MKEIYQANDNNGLIVEFAKQLDNVVKKRIFMEKMKKDYPEGSHFIYVKKTEQGNVGVMFDRHALLKGIKIGEKSIIKDFNLMGESEIAWDILMENERKK